MSKILMICSEAVPLAKTGGMADVCGTLPIELERLGDQTALLMPAYRSVYEAGLRLDELPHVLEIPVGNRIVTGRILRTELPNSSVPVYLISNDSYFDRPGLYGDGKEDYRDNCERYVYFCRAAMEAIRELELDVEILHCHDWQTGLVPTYLALEYGVVRGYEHLRSVLTIHNLAYQGRFWHWDMLLTGLDWKYFNWKQLEFYGDLNLLKAGLVFADALTTVSPRYAQEIQVAPQGCGLEGVLGIRRSDLHGILNGIDDSIWNPALDLLIPRQYGVHNWRIGKAACKEHLQRRLGLAVDPHVPLLGFVGRLVEQKGIDAIVATMRQWVPSRHLQWVILGTGHPDFEMQLRDLAVEYPQRVAVELRFEDTLAHQIEAAADIFLMPSRFEPCGLNQMFSLKYGTVPVVHHTGGLADTIRDPGNTDRRDLEPNGFSFQPFSQANLEQAIHRACETMRDRPDQWQQLVESGMRQDWSWPRSARLYSELYRMILAPGMQTVGA